MRRYALPVVSLLFYLSILGPFTAYLQDKPFAEKLGTVPNPTVMSLLTADQDQSVAAWLVLKVFLYFGGLVEEFQKKVYIPPDYPQIHKVLETAVSLDPYNMDAYYFGNAILAWDAGEAGLANRLLEYGMKYRDWDWSLPFFAGFNYAYFLKDFERSAYFYKRASELSGSQLYAQLTGRYLYEAGQTKLAIAYLGMMVKGSKNANVKLLFETRLQALQQILVVETAMENFHKLEGKAPDSIQILLQQGYLSAEPVDPYGGEFFIDSAGRVRSTSKFAYKMGSRK